MKFGLIACLSLICVFIAADFEAVITLENPEVNTTYENAFRINNLDYTTGFEGEEVYIEQKHNNESWNTSKTVKKYSSSKTSNLTFKNNETQEVCVTINSEKDNNSNNNLICKIFFENKIVETVEECNSNVEIMEPKIFEDKVKLDYEVSNEDFEIDYWVEDLFGNIVKEKTTTNNDNIKQFTPKSAGVYFFFIEARVCNVIVEKNTFFIFKKNQEESLSAELIKHSPTKIETKIDSNNFLEKGIKITYGENEIIADLLQGEQNFYLEINDLCGEQEINILAGEYEESFLLELDNCEKIMPQIPEINSLALENNVVVSIYNPEYEEVEVYLRKNNRKTGTSTFQSGKNMIMTLETEKTGDMEVIAKIGSQTLSSKVDVPGKEEIQIEETGVELKNSNSPIITGNSVAQTPSVRGGGWEQTVIILGILGIFIFLIGDKFKKNSRSPR